MMNRNLAITGITLVLSMTMMCGCGRMSDSSSKETTTGSVYSTSRAVETIEETLGKTVKVDKDHVVAKPSDVNCYITNVIGDSGIKNLWKLDSQVLEPYTIIFLYDGDNKAVVAKNTTADYLNADYEVSSSFSDTGLAWSYCGECCALFGHDEGFNASSIWSYNESDGSISIIYKDGELGA